MGASRNDPAAAKMLQRHTLWIGEAPLLALRVAQSRNRRVGLPGESLIGRLLNLPAPLPHALTRYDDSPTKG